MQGICFILLQFPYYPQLFFFKIDSVIWRMHWIKCICFSHCIIYAVNNFFYFSNQLCGCTAISWLCKQQSTPEQIIWFCPPLMLFCFSQPIATARLLKLLPPSQTPNSEVLGKILAFFFLPPNYSPPYSACSFHWLHTILAFTFFFLCLLKNTNHSLKTYNLAPCKCFSTPL